MEITLHPQLKRVLKMAASFALVILISGGSVMALSPTARAAVMGWLFGRESDAYVYRSTGTDTNSNTITTYDFAKIPEGYTLWQNMVMPNSSLVIYAEDETGRFLKVFAAPNDGSGALYLIPEDATLIPIQLGDSQADSQETVMVLLFLFQKTHLQFLFCSLCYRTFLRRFP